MALDRTCNPSESPLSPAILRSLGDRSYDKRKNAALEIEALIKALQENRDTDRICSVIAMLGQDFATSTNANHRKGGLIGLAAAAIGLRDDIHLYLDALLPPVLHCLEDPESRVRYYSCESLYNIAKVARGCILKYFNQIFDGLCKLFADIDIDVKNGANLLDRLVKDVVAESESFDVEKFVPLLQKYIRRSNPYIRQLLVGWISVLDSVPDINMLDWLPDFLDGLFNMLSDSNREIRQAADLAIAGFLDEIKKSPHVEFGPMVGILVSQCRSTVQFNRLLFFYSELLGSIMHCISDNDLDIRELAGQAHGDLLDLIKLTKSNFELSPLLQTLTTGLVSHHIPTRIAALRWINMLLDRTTREMNKFIGELLPSLLCTLSDEADEVILADLEALARISLVNNDEFHRVLNAILQLFFADRRLLELRGSLIIRNLCAFLNAKSIFMSLASILSLSAAKGEMPSELPYAKDDTVNFKQLNFRCIMVQTLSLILLTTHELDELRLMLQSSLEPGSSQEGTTVFKALFGCWCHNPIAALALCLIAQAYELASALVSSFVDVDITVGFLMQVDKLVQLLESPVFLQLRLQLLDVRATHHPFLLNSLYGLLMLLPQSVAFATLSKRLATVPSTQVGSSIPPLVSSSELQRDLLQSFKDVQASHSTTRKRIVANMSLTKLKSASGKS